MNRLQLSHVIRCAKQWLFTPDIAIIGGYHGGNLGDNALGIATAQFAAEFGMRAGRQTIYNLHKWRPVPRCIVGGGAVAHYGPLRELSRRYGSKPENVAIIGVDFNDDDAALEHKDFLQRVALIECRSQRQATELSELISRPNICAHSDLVFALRGAHPLRRKSVSACNTIGVNVGPFFYRRTQEGFKVGTAYEDEFRKRRPHLMMHNEELGHSYRANLLKLCSEYRQGGYRVTHIPFTPEDDKLARVLLGNVVSEFQPYRPRPQPVLNAITQCRLFIPTRFHSLVFAILARVPIVPFAYAEKSECLLDELGIERTAQLRGEDILHTDVAFWDRAQDPVLVPNGRVREASRSAIASLRRAYASLCGK